MKLSLKIIEKYDLPKVSFKPDWDDAGYKFTLPSGIELEGFFMLNGEPCKTNCLEGMSGYIYIETEEELKELIALDHDQTIEWIKIKHPDADLSDFGL